MSSPTPLELLEMAYLGRKEAETQAEIDQHNEEREYGEWVAREWETEFGE